MQQFIIVNKRNVCVGHNDYEDIFEIATYNQNGRAELSPLFASRLDAMRFRDLHIPRGEISALYFYPELQAAKNKIMKTFTRKDAETMLEILKKQSLPKQEREIYFTQRQVDAMKQQGEDIDLEKMTIQGFPFKIFQD